MFSLFKKPVSLPYSDKVWKTRPVMLRGMTAEGLKVISQSGVVIMVSWFKDGKQSLVDFFVENKVPHEMMEVGGVAPEPKVYLVDARGLISSTSLFYWLAQQTSAKKTAVLFDGHYPVMPEEEKVMEKLKTLKGANINVIFCQSLDGPFFKQFGGERLVSMLEQLGVKDDECIEHPMITTAITRTREKLSKTIGNEISASSEDEWFGKNMK